jgi:hypothetical protein
MTYRKLLTAISRAEELEREIAEAREVLNAAETKYGRTKSEADLWLVDAREADVNSADAQLDEEIDWESL